jgi:hypothetical protein
MRAFRTFLLTSLLATTANATNNVERATCVSVFLDSANAACTFSSGGWEYRISPFGSAVRTRRADSQVVDLDRGFHDLYIVGLQHVQRDSDLVLICETGGDPQDVLVFRLNGASMAIEWTLPLPIMFPSDGLLAGAHLFIGGTGYICSINLDSGRIAWQHLDLWDSRQRSPISFKRPVLDGTFVVFEELLWPSAKSSKPKIIRANASTGEIQHE